MVMIILNPTHMNWELLVTILSSNLAKIRIIIMKRANRATGIGLLNEKFSLTNILLKSSLSGCYTALISISTNVNIKEQSYTNKGLMAYTWIPP